jgi:DNA repair protein RadC
MSQHIFQFSSELQNTQAEVAPSSPNFSLSVSEKLSRYGANALSDVEHLSLLVGKEAVASRLLAHFGSLKALSRASGVEFRPFMTTRQAERLVAALAVSARAQTQDAFQEPFDSPETVYRSCLDMQAFQQEVLRVVLLDARFRRITAESLPLMSQKALSTNHSRTPGKFFGPQSPILPTLWSLCTIYG